MLPSRNTRPKKYKTFSEDLSSRTFNNKWYKSSFFPTIFCINTPTISLFFSIVFWYILLWVFFFIKMTLSNSFYLLSCFWSIVSIVKESIYQKSIIFLNLHTNYFYFKYLKQMIFFCKSILNIIHHHQTDAKVSNFNF